jgi:UMF1 family MFS transporter
MSEAISLRPSKARPWLSASAVSWSFFEAGRTSYSVLIGIYVFIPYVAAVLVGDPVKGQHLVAELGKWAGLAAAFAAPLLGSTIDHIGRRKPALVTLSAVLIPLVAALWWAAPGGAGLGLTQVACLLATCGLLFGLCEVLHNSMLVNAADPRERPFASGLAMAFGNGVSVLLLVLVLWAFVLPNTMDAPWLPSAPLLGLDGAAHEPERAMGPLVALVLLVTVVPMVLFSRDAPRTGHSLGAALNLGLRDLRGLIDLLREEKNARTYLFARLVFADGQVGIIMFTGVFAAGVFGWGPTQLMIEGLVASVFAVLGGLLAGVLDSRIGPKRSLVISLTATAACVIGEIGTAKDRIFYFWSYDPAVHGRPWSGPIFNTWPEWAFIGCDLGVSVFVVAGLASSRTMMAQLAPPDRTAAFFGLYALSGRATAWLCPMLVGLATAAFGSQQLGLSPIVVLLIAGMLGLAFVRAPSASSGMA